MNTPWGASQTRDNVAEGIDFYSTMGHGGFKLSPERNKQVPAKWRLGGRFLGWYEEDCGWAPLFKTFPDIFKKECERTGDYIDRVIEDWESWVRRAQ